MRTRMRRILPGLILIAIAIAHPTAAGGPHVTSSANLPEMGRIIPHPATETPEKGPGAVNPGTTSPPTAPTHGTNVPPPEVPGFGKITPPPPTEIPQDGPEVVGPGSPPPVVSEGEKPTAQSEDDGTRKVPQVPQTSTKNPPDSACQVAFFRGHEYWFCRVNRGFQDARDHCEKQRMRLVRIDDYAENEFVHGEIAFDSWIGATDRAHPGDWRWTDEEEPFWIGGTRGEPIGVAYENWDRWRFGDDPQRRCAAIDKSEGEWNNLNCDWRKDYVCEGSLFGEGEPRVPDSSCSLKDQSGHAYWFCESPRTFSQARNRCQAVDADLVVIDDEQENDFVRSHIRTDSFIGLSDADQEGIWRWVADDRLGWCGIGNSGPPAASTFANWDTTSELSPRGTACDRNTFENRDYLFCVGQAPWREAERTCRSLRMSLAQVGSEKELAFLQSNLDRPSWLGATDSFREGMWHWLGESQPFWRGGPNGSAVAGALSLWETGEPGGGPHQNCLSLEHASKGYRDTECSKPLGWVCEGVQTAARDRPTANDCALIAQERGSWHATRCDQPAGYVCETKAANAGRTLQELAGWVRHDVRSGNEQVNFVAFGDQAQVFDPFLRYLRDFGLRECVDSLDPVGEPRILPHTGLEQVAYQQHYRGVPVHNTGYGIQRDPATGAVVSLTGSVVHDLNVVTLASVSEEEAFRIAVGSIGGNPDEHAPREEGKLVIVPTRYGPKSDWVLAWLFALAPVGQVDGYTVAVSAATGQVVLSVPQRHPACVSTPMDALQPEDLEREVLEINAFQQEIYGDPNTATATHVPQGNIYPHVLYSAGFEPIQSSLPLFEERPLIVARCPTESSPYAISLESSSITSIEPDSPESHLAAPVFMSAQRCLEHFAASFQTFAADPEPWIGYDGTGDAAIDIRFHEDFSGDRAEAYYDPSDATINFRLDRLFYVGASIDMVGHEMAHGLWHSLGLDSSDLANWTLNEGFADIVGATAEMRFRGYPGPGAVPSGWCSMGDETLNATCRTNIVDPGILPRQEPEDYGGPYDYCHDARVCQAGEDPGFTDCCDEHHNASVLSHWFYLITSGNPLDESAAAAACPDTVEPLRPDLESSVAVGLNILFAGLHEYAGTPQGGFPDLANATISAASAARDNYGAASREMQTIVAGWYAANVRENFDEIASELVEPRRGEVQVYAWQTFVWPAFADETSWDLEIFDELDDASEPPPGGEIWSLSLSDIGSEAYRDGQRFGTIDIALKTDVDRIHWRVRPHLADSGIWENCYPWHWFYGVHEVEDIESIEVIEELDENHQVRPGTVRFRWDPVDGAKDYRIHLATHNTHCVDEESVLAATSEPQPDADGKLVTWVPGVQPNETYWIHIQPVGPNGADGEPALGKCATQQFSTTSMRPPVVLYPEDDLFAYASPHNAYNTPRNPLHFRWLGVDGPDAYSLRFYLRGGDGSCASLPLYVREVRETCRSPEHNDACVVRLAEDLFPTPNPTGYCWDVVSHAENDASEASAEKGVVRYYLPMAKKIAPGVQTGYAELYHSAAPLVTADGSFDTWGTDVTFEWEAVPDAAGYILKLGSWPWRGAPIFPDPYSCFSQESHFCDYEPMEVVYRGFVSGTSVTLHAADVVASQGRYCWSVWPILGDPDSPETEPVIFLDAPYCYTSGPAEPLIDVDWPSPVGFSSDPINGSITLPYVPDDQWALIVTPEDDFSIGGFEDGCAIGPLYFRDLTNCIKPFTIYPQPGQTYEIKVQTFNSPEVDPVTVEPVRDEAFRVHETTDSFTTGICGVEGEPCCEEEPYCEKTYCTDGVCPACGDVNIRCCNVPPYCEAPLGVHVRCVDSTHAMWPDGYCETCGGLDEHCCAGICYVDRESDRHSHCVGGHCRECGKIGLPCCTHTDPPTCHTGVCEDGDCVEFSEPTRLPDLQIRVVDQYGFRDCDDPEITNIGDAPTPSEFFVVMREPCTDSWSSSIEEWRYLCPVLDAGESIYLLSLWGCSVVSGPACLLYGNPEFQIEADFTEWRTDNNSDSCE